MTQEDKQLLSTAPDKIYINGFSAFATEPVKEGTEYIRKDIVDDMLKLAEDHAFLAGADWQREQMMEEAVEGVVMDFSSNRPRPQVDVLLDPHKYHTGDKVRIIILKEE